MKVISVREVKEFIVETDSLEWDIYRTDGEGNWEILMGCSWEELYDDDDIQEAYKDFLHQREQNESISD